ncbi:uncharacterized protein LOC118240129 [Electrophorus electricus]|uniref:uncharacterized protein LOC118240129 n=1 Tax=Electrophorus electricus TaxID=8005 RepID=UPI0015CFA62F|nr:uncharacterized protein LOC118240129 [Electrophorus electricus]
MLGQSQKSQPHRQRRRWMSIACSHRNAVGSGHQRITGQGLSIHKHAQWGLTLKVGVQRLAGAFFATVQRWFRETRKWLGVVSTLGPGWAAAFTMPGTGPGWAEAFTMPGPETRLGQAAPFTPGTETGLLHLASTTAWFGHTPGDKPLLIASAYHSEPVLYYKHFNKTGRHNAVRKGNNFTLSISNAESSDSATHYCAVSFYSHIGLKDCTVLKLKGNNATLKCTVLIKRCAGEHSVYWFRHGSGEPHPGIIYTHGDRSGQCKKSSEAGSYIQRCVYMLPKKNLSLSDAGTYYCAVAECGEIIFGNGTKLNFADKN